MQFLTNFLAILSNLTMAVSGGQPSMAKSIEAARQKHWVLLVAAPTPTSMQPDFQEQKKLLTTAAASLQEHNILVMHLPHGELMPSEEVYLQQHCGLHLKRFEVVLLGKTGNIKLRSTHVLAPELLFNTINS